MRTKRSSRTIAAEAGTVELLCPCCLRSSPIVDLVMKSSGVWHVLRIVDTPVVVVVVSVQLNCYGMHRFRNVFNKLFINPCYAMC